MDGRPAPILAADGYLRAVRELYQAAADERHIGNGVMRSAERAHTDQPGVEERQRVAADLRDDIFYAKVVDGEIFWGQDRLDFVARKLAK